MKWRYGDKTRRHPADHHAHDSRSGQPIYHDPDRGGMYGDGHGGENDEACRRLRHEGSAYLWHETGSGERWHPLEGRGDDHHGGLDHAH